MTERDSGRYNVLNNELVETNVRIDFAWGNIPIQPNDDRGEAELVYELDSHNIAVDGYAGYPQAVSAGFVQIPQVLSPENFSQYSDRLTALGLVPVLGNTESNTIGSQLNGQVTTSDPVAGSVVAVGSTVSVNKMGNYASAVNHNIAGIRKQFGGSDLPYNEVFMFLQGQNHNLFNGNTVNITGCDVDAYNKNGWIVLDAVNDNAFNTGGTKVTLFWNGVFTETANGTGGTYTKA